MMDGSEEVEAMGGETKVQVLDVDSDTIRLRIGLPTGYRFLPDQHHFLNVSSSDPSVLSVPPYEIHDLTFDWWVPIRVEREGEAVLHLEGMVFFCPDDEPTMCIYSTVREDVPVRVLAGSGRRAEVFHQVTDLQDLDSHRMTVATSRGAAGRG